MCPHNPITEYNRLEMMNNYNAAESNMSNE